MYWKDSSVVNDEQNRARGKISFTGLIKTIFDQLLEQEIYTKAYRKYCTD